jgi:hypothetical protein
VDEADGFVVAAERALDEANGRVQAALVNMASLLRQPPLLSLLEQGKQEKFIAEVLATKTDEKLAEVLAERVPAARPTSGCWRST